ncbi:ArnT family glycosyltransferase [Sphingomonas natans]|nr:glycosyltransferase family 39 protein [Sphingomonas sp. BIUV-7]
MPLVTGIALLVATLLLRAPTFGDPAPFLDEQFYLLVGDRLLHGAVPYVDIWDRKPIGLFLLYAAIRLLGGQGVYQYQVVAALFAWAGAWAVSRIARRAAPEPAALFAGLAYLLWIETVEGGGGQSPVFYNPLVAFAALATLRAIESSDVRRSLRHGFVAMALGGIAIQIKYTALFEVAFFGLVLAGLLLRRLPLAKAVGWTGLLAAAALFPTLLAWVAYAAIGRGQSFVFANFVSIMLRDTAIDGKTGERLITSLGHLAPLSLCTAASLWQLRRSEAAVRRWALFLMGWIGAALAGYFLIGGFYYHYLMPLYVPLAVGLAPIAARRPIGIGFAAIALWIPLANLGWPDLASHRRSREQIEKMVALLPADVDRGCLFEYDGPPILFQLAHACTLSRFVFPDHLSSRVEQDALGIDSASEVRRILAAHPSAITIGREADAKRNPRTAAILFETLRRSYWLAGSANFEGRTIDMYVRR